MSLRGLLHKQGKASGLLPHQIPVCYFAKYMGIDFDRRIDAHLQTFNGEQKDETVEHF